MYDGELHYSAKWLKIEENLLFFWRVFFQKRISCCCTSSSWNDGNDLNIFPLRLIKVWDFGQGMSFQKTRLIVSSLFHLQIKLTSSASDPELRQSFQRRKVRNVEQWSLSVSTILELEGRGEKGGKCWLHHQNIPKNANSDKSLFPDPIILILCYWAAIFQPLCPF